jgi:hypothetical protein
VRFAQTGDWCVSAQPTAVLPRCVELRSAIALTARHVSQFSYSEAWPVGTARRSGGLLRKLRNPGPSACPRHRTARSPLGKRQNAEVPWYSGRREEHHVQRRCQHQQSRRSRRNIAIRRWLHPLLPVDEAFDANGSTAFYRKNNVITDLNILIPDSPLHRSVVS